MVKFKYKTQMYKHLQMSQQEIYKEARTFAQKQKIPADLAGQFGLTGAVSGCPAPLREDIIAYTDSQAKVVTGLAAYVEEMRLMVKDFYGADYDVCPVNTCEAGLWTCFTTLFTPPMMGEGYAYRCRYIAPYEKHLHHQAGYGRPFPPKYKDIAGDRGTTPGELGVYGKRQFNLDTVIVPLEGACYPCHGIKYFPVPLLTKVKARDSKKALEDQAARHAANLTGFTSIGYDTPGYGYGEKDNQGTPVLQKYIAELAHSYNVPYIIDNAWGLPFVGTDITRNGADAIVYSLDKATGSPLCGLIIGKEDLMVHVRRAMGFHGDRYGTIASYGKAADVAFDPGKEALCGAIAAMRVLKDQPEVMTRPVDEMYEVVTEAFKDLDPGIKDGFLFTKSYNSCAVEVNYEGTWKKDKMGVPIFSIEDMYSNSNIFQTGLAQMGIVPTIAYDGNIMISTGLNTLDEKGNLRKDLMYTAVKCLVELINITSRYAGILD